ncbi:MAG TPA: hypothetical protein VF801_06600 [Rhodocyclaceae bacterium]
MRDTFFANLHGMMARDDKVFVLSADFGAPTLDAIRNDFPQRFINVGIAEQNLIAVAAGLALEGHKVVCYAIAPFITMRCLEQIRVNLAILSQLRPMSVTLIGVGAGMSYEVSGPTHHCIEDVAVLAALPNVHVWSPSDAQVSGALAEHCVGGGGIHYIRCDAKPQPPLSEAPVDLRRGFRALTGRGATAVVSTGYPTQVIHGLFADHPELEKLASSIDVFNINGFDEAALADQLRGAERILVVQESVRDGGLDARIRRLADERRFAARVAVRAMAGAYSFDIGSRDRLHRNYGLSRDQLAQALLDPNHP